MKYDIYIDGIVIFIWIWNAYLLWTVRKVLSCTATQKRIILAALAGALITGISMILPAGHLYVRLFIGTIISGFVMLRIGFVFIPLRNYLKVTLICAVCSFLEGSIFLRIGSLWEGRKKWLMLFLIPLLLWVVSSIKQKLQVKKNHLWLSDPMASNPRFRVRFVCGDKALTAEAVVDTGNYLWDPLYGQPVSLVSRKLADQMKLMWCENSFHVVPYQSVGCRKGLLDAYRIPELIVQTQIEDRHCKLPVIAVADQGIDETFTYQMILHPLMLLKEDDSCYSMWQR